MKIAYIIPETQYDKQLGFRVGIAKEGEAGYYLTDWYWGHDFNAAQKIADSKNIAMHGSLAEADKIVLASFKGGPKTKSGSEKPRLSLIITGGVLTCLYADTPIDVTVIDYDDIEGGGLIMTDVDLNTQSKEEYELKIGLEYAKYREFVLKRNLFTIEPGSYVVDEEGYQFVVKEIVKLDERNYACKVTDVTEEDEVVYTYDLTKLSLLEH